MEMDDFNDLQGAILPDSAKRKVFKKPDPPMYLEAPSWGSQVPYGGGGTRVTAVLGINMQGLYVNGSATVQPPQPDPLMTNLAKHYGKYNWMSGHLLNRNFGGRGDEDKNLTALTASGNSQHSALENIVYQALYSANGWYADAKRPSVIPGIRYTVRVSSKKWASTQYIDKVTNRLYVSAETVGWDLDRETLVDIGSGDSDFPATYRKANFTEERVDNTN